MVLFTAHLSAQELSQLTQAQEMTQRGIVLRSMGKAQQALGMYKKMLAKFKYSQNSEILVEIARVMFNQAGCYIDLHRPSSAIKIYNQMIAKFIDSDNKRISLEVSLALFNKGGVLRQLGHVQSAVNSYSKIISNYGSIDNDKISIVISMAMLKRADSLGQLGQKDVALIEYNKIISSSDDQSILINLAIALLHKARLLLTSKASNFFILRSYNYIYISE